MSIENNVSIIVLHKRSEKILLQLRTPDAIIAPNKWVFFGGSIESGESPLDCIIREIEEELKYILTNPKYLFTQEFDGTYHVGDKHIFIEEYDRINPLILCEGAKMQWFTLDEAEKLNNILQQDLEIIQFLKNYFNQVKYLKI